MFHIALLGITSMAEHLFLDNMVAKYVKDATQLFGPDALASCP